MKVNHHNIDLRAGLTPTEGDQPGRDAPATGDAADRVRQFFCRSRPSTV